MTDIQPPENPDQQVAAAIETASEERIIDLEMRLTFAEDLIDSLNSTLAQQQQELMEMRRLFGQLLQRQRSLSEQLPGTQRRLEDEIPPHY